MGLIRSKIASVVRGILQREGLVIVRPDEKYGLDPFSDIRRLADRWRYSIDRVFDIGANDGETALSSLNCLPGVQVISFEPHPATYKKLVSRLNGKPNFEGVNVALGATVGKTEMFEYDETSKISSLTADAHYVKRFGLAGRAVPIRVTTLDAFCAERGIDSVSVLKIDTEGFDLVVLEGGRGLLERRAVKFIYVEFNDIQPKDGAFGGALLPFDQLLRPYGYRFIASYIDYIITEGEMFSVANALFALPPV